MEFETVYKTGKIEEIGWLPQDEKWVVFLTEKQKRKLAELMEKAEEYKQIFFLRESSYHVFCDFPAMGAEQSEFSSSFVTGPFVSPPEIKEANEYYNRAEHSKSILKRFMPFDKVPASFEKVELVNYGTRTAPEYSRFIINCDHKLNRGKMTDVRDLAIKKLEENCKSLQKNTLPTSQQCYKGLIGNCTFEFWFSEDHPHHYPKMNIKVFGLSKENPRDIIRELGLYGLDDAFSYRDFGLEHWIRSGLCYDFSMQENPDINEILKSKNIIL